MPGKFRLVPVAAVVFAALGAPAAGAQEATTTAAPAATVDKVGWWNSTRGPQPGEPDNPLRPALAPVPAPPTNVPADAVGVAAALGEPTKIAAVGILLEGAAGGTVDSLKLSVKEATAPGATIGSDQAVIVACPITAFWGETRNGNWIDRPEADCDLASAEGTRGADGTWTFDLTSVAAAAGWLDPASSTGQNGVLLVERVDPPAGFEASFLDPSAGGMTLEFAATGGGAVPDPFATPGDTATSPDFSLSTDPGFVGGELGRTDPITLSPVPVPSRGGGAPSAAAPDLPRPATQPAASTGRAGDLVGNLSWATWLLVPLALVAAVVLSLALGTSRTPAPSGATPAPGRRRLGGVSRALARREHVERRTLTTEPTPWSAS